MPRQSARRCEAIREGDGELVHRRRPFLLSQSKDSEAPKELEHLMIFFDDDPCYEFLCTDFMAC
jgi:hypothetical protein